MSPSGSGILDERNVGGKLTVSNTVVRHTAQSGIKIAAGGAGNKMQATLSNVRVHNSAQAGLTVNGGAKAAVRDSVFSGSAIGIDVELANSEVSVDGSTQPCLVVDRLGNREGDVGLWVDSMPAAFRNLRIQPTR